MQLVPSWRIFSCLPIALHGQPDPEMSERPQQGLALLAVGGVSVAAGLGMQAHSPCIVGASGGSRRVRRRCSCSLKMQTCRGAPGPHGSKDCAASQSGRGAHWAGLRDGVDSRACRAKSKMRSGAGSVWGARPTPPLGLRPTPHGW